MVTLDLVGRSLLNVPEDMVLHNDIKTLLNQRKKMLDTREGITMAFAEALAFGCLMKKFEVEEEPETPLNIEHPTVHVRLSGQDSVRGTFNQRHAKIVCQKTSKSYWQLNNLNVKEQASITVCNSALSEAAVLGFEYGYSLSNEMALTIWEAQFGDFANVAQSIIDNFVVSGESKWANNSSLVMLLPHGYDGQGPEHSSAKLERFLQMVSDDPDSIPGKDVYSELEIEDGWSQLVSSVSDDMADDASMGLDVKILSQEISKFTPNMTTERIDLAINEILSEQGLLQDVEIEEPDHLRHHIKLPSDYESDDVSNVTLLTKYAYRVLMSAWMQRNFDQTQNLIVITPTTPAQYFHALRRQVIISSYPSRSLTLILTLTPQIHRHYAKPCVVMSPKWLLHHKSCTSDLVDMGPGTFFQRVIIESARGDNMSKRTMKTGITFGDPESIKRIIFCSGKIFYHLYHARNTRMKENRRSDGKCGTMFVRIEQIAPFPYDLIAKVIIQYPNAELTWVQEEPKNMGAYGFIKPRFDALVNHMNSEDAHSTMGVWDRRAAHKLASSDGSKSNLWDFLGSSDTEGGDEEVPKYRMKRRLISYIGRKPAASPATGSYKTHQQEQDELIEMVFADDKYM